MSVACAHASGPYIYGANGILKSTRDFTAPGAGKEHTSEVRGGGRDPGVRSPGSGLGRPTAPSLPVLCESDEWFGQRATGPGCGQPGSVQCNLHLCLET